MDLFAFPIEIRLKIYSQLLVHPAFISLEKREHPLPARLWLGESIGLCPALLRTSKQVNDEAVPLLYSNNCFHFPEEDKATTGCATGTTLAFFLRQIGLLARLLRHVCIILPDLSTLSGYSTQFHEDHVNDLDLIRDACGGITTLQLSLPFTSGFPVSMASLDLIDMRVKALPLLQNVIVNVRWYGGESVEASDDKSGDLSGVDDWDHPEGCLAANLRERRWTVQVTKVPPAKEVWTDPDDRFEFDNKDDYHHYMTNVWSRLEWEREQQEEEEYYYQRQLAGYDKGYADDPLVLYFIVKPIFYRFCRWSGSLDGHGPTQGTMIVVIVLTLASAFLTDIIGVHAIFGGFLVGLIMPKTNGFASAITEKIEDLVTVLFLPLYFALSGLKTDLSLLKDGSIWGWTACIVIVAFLSKFLTCAVAARATGFKNRESLTIGALMSCKGLVELIVLNIGLNAGILNAQVFAACVVMALVTTFATTPLVLWFYPQWYRDQKEAALRTGELAGALPTLDKDGKPREAGDGSTKDRFTVVLDRLENLPPLMAFVKLLQPPTILPRPVSIASDGEAKKSDEGSVSSSSAALTRPVHVNAHRLLELSERTSDVLRASTETDEIAQKDPLTNIFKTFAGLNGISVNATLAIVPSSDYHKSIVKSAVDSSADMVIVPWAEGAHAVSPVGHAGESYNPLENIFARGSNDSHLTSPQYANLVRDIFASSSCDVGVFLDRGAGSLPSAVSGSRQHVFFAFRGGFDDRAALQLVVQLCRHTGVSATVVRVVKAADATDSDSEEGLEKTESLEPTPALLSQMTVHATAHAGGADTVYGHQTTHDVLASSTADDLCLARYFGETPDPAFAEALVRVKYSEVRSAAPLKAVLNQAQRAAKEWAASASDRSLPSPSPMMVVVGRGRRGAESHRDELAVILKQHAAANGGVSSLGIAASSDVRRSLGDVGSAVVVDGVGGSLLVIQAGVPKQD